MVKKCLVAFAAVAVLAFAATANARSIPKYHVPAGGHTAGKGTHHAKIFRADGSLYATRDRDAAGTDTWFYNRNGSKKVGVFARTPPRKQVGVHYTNANCGQDLQGDMGYRLMNGGPAYFYFNEDSISGATIYNLAQYGSPRFAIINAFNEWNNHIDWCNATDASNIAWIWSGNLATQFGVRDGVNSISFESDAYLNPFGCGHAAALACSSVWIGTWPWMAEVDMAFNEYYKWNIGDSGPGWDVQGTAAHEAGHWLGLAHVQGIDNVMSTGETNLRLDRKLGRGDGNFINAAY